MPDISHTLIARSDQLNAGDLAAPRVVTVRGVRVTNDEQPVSIDIGPDLQPWKPCKGMRRLLAQTWGTDTDAWPGHRVELYCDSSVTWAGAAVGGIRVSAISGIERATAYTMRTSKKGTQRYQIEPLEKGAPPLSRAEALERFTSYATERGVTVEQVDAFLGTHGTALADLGPDDLRRLASDLDAVKAHAAAPA